MKTKKYDFLSWLTLLLIVCTSLTIHVKLDKIETAINSITLVPKLDITDNKQFTRLCQQLTQQWNGSGYVFYILQPNSPMKTHKEKVSASLNLETLPVRVELSRPIYRTKLIKQKYLILSATEMNTIFQVNTITKTFIVIPVYQHDTIVGELYVMYDSSQIHNMTKANKIAEAQMLSLLMR